MATKKIKLMDLKVTELKRELEERDLETTGTKSALQQRLRVALVNTGEDPESFSFETTSGIDDLCRHIDAKLEATSQNIGDMRTHLEGNLENISRCFNDKIVDMEERVRRIEEGLRATGGEKAVMDVKSSSRPPSAKVEERVVLTQMRNDLPTFDGKSSWEEYLTLFETAAMINEWPGIKKASMLCLSLRGDAIRVLQTIPLAERQDYEQLTQRLEMRFGHRHMEHIYRSQLKNRFQKPNETLQEFEADIIRLVRGAYPTVTDDVYESLAIDRFLDGLRESETQQAVKLARPKTLSEALTQTLEFEAVKQSVKSQARVRALETAGEESQPSMEELVKRVLEALKVQKREIRCWNCGRTGHLRNKCPKPWRQTSEN